MLLNMKYTVITVLFSLASMGCAFYALVYPAWFMQRYERDGKNVFQGFGIFAFYSTEGLDSPFYASKTMLQYSDFCESEEEPNYMLGDGDAFREVLCHKAILSVQATTATGAATSVVSLVLAIFAVFNPSAGFAERVVSFCTLASSLLLAVSLVIWGWLIQQKLYQVDSVSSAYNTCKSDNDQWSCWFYGYSFWVCLASVIMLSVTGYLSSAGRAEKIRYFRKEYERDLATAVQQSMQPHAPAPTPYYTGNQETPYQQAPPFNQAPKYGQDNRQQPINNVPLAPTDSYSYNQQSGYTSQNSGGEAAYPAYREQRPHHSVLGRQPSGGVV